MMLTRLAVSTPRVADTKRRIRLTTIGVRSCVGEAQVRARAGRFRPKRRPVMRSEGEKLESVFMLAFRLDFKPAPSISNSPCRVSFLADHDHYNFTELQH